MFGQCWLQHWPLLIECKVECLHDEHVISPFKPGHGDDGNVQSEPYKEPPPSGRTTGRTDRTHHFGLQVILAIVAPRILADLAFPWFAVLAFLRWVAGKQRHQVSSECLVSAKRAPWEHPSEHPPLKADELKPHRPYFRCWTTEPAQMGGPGLYLGPVLASKN